MRTLDTTIVNATLPSMALSLGEDPLQMHSVIVAYVLTVAITLPVSGWLADRFGGRNVLLSAIIMMFPVGRLTVMKVVPRDQYLWTMTVVTLPGQTGPLIGPALGGVFVQYASWHRIFLINLPVGVIGAITAWQSVMPDAQVLGLRLGVRHEAFGRPGYRPLRTRTGYLS